MSTKRVGRETRYSLDAEPLGDAARWIATVGAEWDERLADLGRLLEQALGLEAVRTADDLEHDLVGAGADAV